MRRKMYFIPLLFLLLAILIFCVTGYYEVFDSSTKSDDFVAVSDEVSVTSTKEEGDKLTFTSKTESDNSDLSVSKSRFQNLIDESYSYKAPSYTTMDRFETMDYVILIKEGVEQYLESGDVWYEYALIGGEYDTYEKGRNFYDQVNKSYEIKREIQYHDAIERSLGVGYIQQFYKRNIIGFSADGKRVLLKTLVDPIESYSALYEFYDGRTHVSSFLQDDFTNGAYYKRTYTNNMQYITSANGTNGGYFCGEIYRFYFIDTLKGDNLLEQKNPYFISVYTDKDDTLYYKYESSKNEDYICLYSIPDDTLIYRSEPIEERPVSVTILDQKMILGFNSKISNPSDSLCYINYLDYFEIDITSGDIKYLFSNGAGEFSPDGKYLAYAPVGFRYTELIEQNRGYYIYDVEHGETVFIPTYVEDRDIKTSRCVTGPEVNNVIGWAHKDGVKSLLK